MTSNKHNEPDNQPEKPEQYQKPTLTRWGTLRELTKGGGGNKKEPGSLRVTRF